MASDTLVTPCPRPPGLPLPLPLRRLTPGLPLPPLPPLLFVLLGSPSYSSSSSMSARQRDRGGQERLHVCETKGGNRKPREPSPGPGHLMPGSHHERLAADALRGLSISTRPGRKSNVKQVDPRQTAAAACSECLGRANLE